MKATKPRRVKPRKEKPLWKVDIHPSKSELFIDIDFVHPVEGGMYYRARTAYVIPIAMVKRWAKGIA